MAMDLKRFLVFSMGLAALSVGSSSAAPEAEALVRRADDLLRPDRSFAVVAEIDSYRNRALAGKITLKTYVRVSKTGGEPDALAFATDPEAERGKVILRHEGVLWLLNPGAERPVKLVGHQRLQGDASLEDLVHLRLAEDYAVTDEGEETIVEASGKSVATRRLKLTAKSGVSSVYPTLRLWIGGAFQRPVKMECLAASGKVLRTVFYDRYRGFLGTDRPAELMIVDGTAPGRVTRIRFSDYSHQELPADWYQPEKMREAKPGN
ncbi:MAG: outer membrane lipoprotein-sorting protein [Verrucomicrobiae bacterium]|nr:outer membrane lipoprotein-sorting protein [Verrucomicrobiae bacterium]